MPNANASPKGFWTTLPGMLTALAAIITALGGLIAALVQAGWLGGQPAAQASATNSARHEPAKANGGIAAADAPANPPATAAVTDAVTDAASPSPYRALRITAKDGSVVSIRTSAELMGPALALANGQYVQFDRLERIEITQPWDGSVRLVLLGGRQMDAAAHNTPVSGSNELGKYLALMSDIRRIDFVR